MFTNILLVAGGGAIGATVRYLIMLGVDRVFDHRLPTATLIVNTVGCFVIGAIGSYVIHPESPRESMRLFLVIGVLGGFTTFSTFGWDVFALFRDQQMTRAGLYILLSNVLGILAVFVGYALVARR